ncbi:Rossmann-like and DUF2520 domain-containing protein [Aquimarina intermedia]|uniref:Uncharacterized protein DUF2520 n=1 Tax=Aquimarina intermedia TaxID=350814 RepID=A0A5S5C7C4_9FLAO|nr:DUF2520 domain-containing protein [Aquimarina intermedia]TYP74296.1 uncharacterized protein DUF2520 [Aquimarina intermedia]
MIRVILLGSGNVAVHLYEAIQAMNTFTVIQCYNRRGMLLHPNQEPGVVTSDFSKIKEADLYIIAVSDTAISDVSENLQFENRLVVHTSGSVAMNAIHDKHRKGVLYPLQSFSINKPVDFTTIPMCLEAEQEDDYYILQQLAEGLSQHVYAITSAQRKTIHLAAVFVNNFTNHLYQIGKEICDQHQVPFEILQPLIQETSAKIVSTSPLEAQTGPARRYDQATIRKQLEALTNPLYKALYENFTKSIQNTHGEEL